MLIAYELNFFHIVRIWKEKKQKLRITLIVASNKIEFLNRIRIAIIHKIGFAKIQTRVVHINEYRDDDGSAIQFGLIEKSRKLSLLGAQKEIRDIKLQTIFNENIIPDFHLILAQKLFHEILDALRKSELAMRICKDDNYTILLTASKRCIKLVDTEISAPVIYIKKSRVMISFFLDFIGVFFGLILMFGKRFISVGPAGHSEMITVSTLYTGYESERVDIRNNINWFIEQKDSQLKLFTLANFDVKKFLRLRSRVHQNKTSVLHLNKLYFSRTRIFQSSPRETVTFIFSILKLNSRRYGTNDKISLFSLISRFIWELESNYYFVRKFKCRVFVYDDVHFLSHVMNALAKLDQIDTIKLQYSNLGMKSLFMLSNPSKMLVFSNDFRSYFSDNEFALGPKNYIESGYSLNTDSQLLLDRSKDLRKILESYGASYIIGVFDESVQSDDNLWAWKTKSEYLTEVESLCEYVLSNKDVGVVFKTQFVRNNPSNLFPHNKLIAEALSTNRIIFPWLGTQRNLILPCEIALASDICIGDIVGGTASLEAALCGVKSIMIDSMHFGIKHRRIYYEHEGIVFKDFNSGLVAISQNRMGVVANKPIGNWSLLLSELGISAENTRKKINKEITLSMNR